MVPNHPGVDHPLKFCPMLGESKHVQALVPVLPGRTCTSDHCPALEFPLLTPKLDPVTRLDGQRSRLSPKAGRGLLRTSYSRNRSEVVPGSRRHLYPQKEAAPTAPSHIN